jgi:UDPglucose--hexose-1-phosphate uridylyltransferase
MSRVAFERETFETELLDPRRSFERTRTTVEARRNPLPGPTARILPAGSFPPPAQHDLERLAASTRDDCPFCTERIEEQTPRLPPEIWPEGRIHVGEAVLFPNLVPYAKWSSVSVYSAGRHNIPLRELTPQLVADNLRAQREFARAAHDHDRASTWIGVNANHLPPAGSSIFHPHLQGSVNPLPTTMQRLLAQVGPDALQSYLAAEHEAAERLVASSTRVTWLASFAPLGPAEICAFVDGARDSSGLTDIDIDELARGISAALRVYDDLGFQSFNLALYGVCDFVLLRLVARAYFGAAERSDAMWSERLQWEAATDLAPEHVAELARAVFV